jgi:serralysin
MSSGANSSIVGGAGDIAATASGANTTLIGGSGTSNFTVSGAGSIAVSGPGPGTTNISLTDTGGAEVATNPLGNSGTLVASLSATGADTVVGGSGHSSITGGGGHDVFAFVAGHGGGTETISGFTSSDTFAFSSAYGYSLTNPPPEQVVAGNDVITLTDGTEITTITLVGINHTLFSKDS